MQKVFLVFFYKYWAKRYHGLRNWKVIFQWFYSKIHTQWTAGKHALFVVLPLNWW